MANNSNYSHRRKYLGHPSEKGILAVLFFLVGATVLLGVLMLLNQPR